MCLIVNPQAIIPRLLMSVFQCICRVPGWGRLFKEIGEQWTQNINHWSFDFQTLNSTNSSLLPRFSFSLSCQFIILLKILHCQAAKVESAIAEGGASRFRYDGEADRKRIPAYCKALDSYVCCIFDYSDGTKGATLNTLLK